MKIGMNRFEDKVISRAALKSASGNNRPNPFVGDAAFRAASALGYPAVDHDKADGLFRHIIGWIHAGCRNKCEIGFPMVLKALYHVPHFFFLFFAVLIQTTWSLLQGGFQDRFLGVLQCILKRVRRHLFAGRNDLEKVFHLGQKFFSLRLGFPVRQPNQVADIPNEMRPTKRQRDTAIFHGLAVGGKIVPSQNAMELFPQPIQQDLGTARLVNLEPDIQIGFENPGPKSFAVFFVPRFIHIQVGFQGEAVESLFLGRFQGRPYFLDHFPQIAPAYLER